MADTYLDLAGHIRDGRHGDARAYCQDLLRAEPNTPAHRQLAAVVARRCQGASARPPIAPGLSSQDPRVATLVLAGSIARDAGDGAAAMRLFGQAQQLAPDDPEPAFLHCAALLEAGRAEASSQLGLLLARFAGSAPGWSVIGEALSRANQDEAALVAFARACRIAPSPGLHMCCGKALLKLGRANEATAAYGQARILQPTNHEAAYGQALCHKQAGRMEAATAALRDAVRLQPRAAAAWFALGLMEQDQGAYRAAIAAYETAIACEPGLAEPVLNLGICWQELGDLEAAKAAYGRALRLRADTFGRIAQALTMSPKGELWLDLEALRLALA